jgi:general transcription factor 3C polypeptide 3 (transcription factor C subunit 4)
LLQLAELCSILEVPDEALQRFDEFIAHCLKDEKPGRTHLTWTLILSYSDLLIQQERYDEALQQLKSLSRWLLGRADEEYWNLLSDDREWDDFDEPRRMRVPEYTQAVHEPEQYGLGLPIELRIKLGNLRLQMGDNHFGEALVSFDIPYFLAKLIFDSGILKV